jgi:hypothetical protein
MLGARTLSRDESGGHVGESTSSTREVDVVMEAVSILMAWRTAPNFRARVFHRIAGDTEREYELEAEPRECSYRLVEVETGAVDQFVGETRRLTSGTVSLDFHVYMVAFEPPAARLAFPMSLGVWGRPTDGYRMVGGHRVGDTIVVRLVHISQPALNGSLTVSRSSRMAVRLDTPTETCRYEGIEPL